MIRNINILILCLFAQLSFAQIIWLEPTQKDGLEVLSDRISHQEYEVNEKTKTINYHNAIGITNPIHLDLGESNLNQCNIYTVYRPSGHAEEQLIWSVQSQSQDQLTLTDRRMVDYTKSKFMNFLDRSPLDVQINNYQHYQNAYPGDQILIGGTPSNTKVPVQLFRGDIAELIVFDQMLAPMAKQQMESYLALKYSIPLAENLDYVDGNTDVIWKANKETKYKNRIAGIGKDSRTTLNQKQSQSLLGTGTLSIGIGNIENRNTDNHNELADQEYLLWSDDDGLINYETQEAQNPILQRKWKLYTKRYQSHQNVVLRIDHKNLIQDLEIDEKLWLCIDPSGADEFKMRETQFIPLASFHDYHETLPFSIENQNDLHFSFMKAPEMWAAIDLTLPECGINNGSINVKAIGGNAPYQITLQSEDSHHQVTITEENEIYTLNDLKASKYQLIIKDAQDREWTKTFYLNNKEIEIPQLKNTYYLEEETLTIDADPFDKNDYEYQWRLGAEIISNQASISFSQSGKYQLIISDGACIFQKEIQVIDLENNISDLIIYPNPTTSGYFKLQATLKEATTYTIEVHDLNGRLLYSQTHPEAKYLEWDDWILRSGVYLISLHSGNDTETRKLIVL